MDREDEDKLKGEAAYKVMRKKYPQLFHVLVTNDIPAYLYSEDLIENESFKKYSIPEITSDQKGRNFYHDIHDKVKDDYTVFEKMIEIIKEHGLRQEKLIKSLEG